MIVAGASWRLFQPRQGSAHASRAVVYFVSLVILLAAGLKLAAIRGGDGFASIYFWQSRGMNMAAALAEWALAAWLLSGIAPAWARRVTIITLLLFAAVSGFMLFKGSVDCGCFGRVRVNPRYTLAFDIVMALALIFVSPVSEITDPSRMRRRVLLTVLPCLPLIFVFGSSLIDKSSQHDVVIIDRATSLSRPFPLIAYLSPDDRERVSSGRCKIVLFDHDCDRCRQFLESLASEARTADADPVWAIDVALDESGRLNKYRSLPVPAVQLLRNVVVVGDFPLIVHVQRGIVKQIEEARVKQD